MGISATTNHADSDLLNVFSTSTEFEPEQSYSKFAAYAILNHGGDFSAAGKALWEQGYRPEQRNARAKGNGQDEEPEPQIREWPKPLGSEAFHGVLGEIVRAIEPHSESDPVALLVQLLVATGNALGRGPHWTVESSRHALNLFAVFVGETSKARKGTSWGHARRIVTDADSSWAARIVSGLSSGEGLIWQVRDPIEKREPVKKKGRIDGYETVVVDEGVEDKRLTVVEPEFASTLRVAGRDGSTLSSTVPSLKYGHPTHAHQELTSGRNRCAYQHYRPHYAR